MLYKFKRDFYTQLEASIRQNAVTFVLGPRKSGKTYAMLQYEEEHSCLYYNGKEFLSEAESYQSQLLASIKEAIDNHKNIVYLIDEITYFYHPEQLLHRIYRYCYLQGAACVRVVITGSQSVALQAWAAEIFCGCCGIVRTNFLQYHEWLRFKGEVSPTEANHQEYLLGVRAFSGFSSLESYLEGCIDETIQSNLKSVIALRHNEAKYLTADILTDIMFCALINTHIGVSYPKFIGKNRLEDILALDHDLVDLQKRRICNLVDQHYTSLYKLPVHVLVEALTFLSQNGLIGFTWVGTNCDYGNITASLITNSLHTLPKDDYGSFVDFKLNLFKYLGVYVKHPIFSAAIVDYVLEDSSALSGGILGDIVECEVRSLLPPNNQFEYHDIEDNEIDYVNDALHLAVEITISDNHVEHFDLLPDGYTNILLSKTHTQPKRTNAGRAIQRVPYYEYICHLSKGKDPSLTDYNPKP